MPRSISFLVPEEAEGSRLDHFLQGRLPDLSRTFIKKSIEVGYVTLDGKVPKKAGVALSRGSNIHITIPDIEPLDLKAEDMDIDILYEDPAIAVVEKPAGIVVHPSAGHSSGTLVNALLARLTSLSKEGGSLRPGIVHRLDKDTSGVMIVAKADRPHRALAAQFASHTITRRYRAVVKGIMREKMGEIESFIGRHPRHRKKMAVLEEKGRKALTRFRVIDEMKGFSLVELSLYTGRTHQIRVHCSHLGHPVVGDPVYSREGRNIRISRGKEVQSIELKRTLLHAYHLGFNHPVTGEPMVFETEAPEEFASFWAFLEGS